MDPPTEIPMSSPTSTLRFLNPFAAILDEIIILYPLIYPTLSTHYYSFLLPLLEIGQQLGKVDIGGTVRTRSTVRRTKLI